jgi:hypothetical protein
MISDVPVSFSSVLPFRRAINRNTVFIFVVRGWSYYMKLPVGIDGKKFSAKLEKSFIAIRRPNAEGEKRLTVNETLLYKDAKYVVEAIKQGIKMAAN